jgi:hypothetical protein
VTRRFRVVIELLLPDEDRLLEPGDEKYKDIASISEWVTTWLRDDLIYEADEEFDGKLLEVSELSA